MATHIRNQKSRLAPVFAGVSVLAAFRKSRSRRGSAGSRGGKGHKLKGLVQFTDVDEDKIVRLARRKQMMSKDVPLAKAPMVVWMRVVTEYGKTVMMNADQFDAGGAGNAISATPHFS